MIDQNVPSYDPRIAEFTPWLFFTVLTCDAVAANSSFFWLFRDLGARRALELVGGQSITARELIKKEGMFPSRLSHVFHRLPATRHQSTNVAIQLWFNVLTHQTAEALIERNTSIDGVIKLGLVSLAAALGAAPGAYSIVRKIDSSSPRPSLAMLCMGVMFETVREAGFNVGCLKAGQLVDRNLESAGTLKKTIAVGALSAGAGFLTGIPHALACLAYRGKVPTRLGAKTLAPMMKSCGLRSLAVGMTFASSYGVESVAEHMRASL